MCRLSRRTSDPTRAAGQPPPHEDTEARGDVPAATDLLGALGATMREGLIVLNAAGRIKTISETAASLLGGAQEEIAGEPLGALLDPLDEAAAEALDWLRGGDRGQAQPLRLEAGRFRIRGGRSWLLTLRCARFGEPGGERGHVILIDIASRSVRRALRLGRQPHSSRLGPSSSTHTVERALAENRLLLHVQPIVEIATGAVVQREALLRIRPGAEEAAEELIPPGSFLPAAERTGFVKEIDRWVVSRCSEFAAGGAEVELNLSVHSVVDSRMLEHISSELTRTGAAPGRLVFEITETALLQDEAAARRFVERVHELGCRVALDDFGSGYSSLRYLKQLPVDFLKIDREFVSDLTENLASQNVVEAIVGLAGSFGLQTVAEGVEERDTLAALRELGVDRAQGYLLGRPASLTDGARRARWEQGARTSLQPPAVA